MIFKKINTRAIPEVNPAMVCLAKSLFCPPIILIVETLKPWDKKNSFLNFLKTIPPYFLLTYTDQILNEPWSDSDKSDADGLIHKQD